MLLKLKTLFAYMLICIGILTGCGEDAFLTDSEKQAETTTTGSGTGNDTNNGIDATGMTQLTTEPPDSDGGLGSSARLSGNGNTIVFVSNLDPLGQNSDSGNPNFSNELFIVNSNGTGLAQLTDSTGFGAIGGLMDLSSDGSVIVFTSEADYLGLNADLDDEIFIVNSDGTGLAQLTNDPDHISQAPNITSNGQKIAFNSTADPLGSNPNNDFHIFTINSDGTGLTQVTTFNARVSRFSMSKDGSKIAFTSDQDVMGTGTDNTDEIFVINSDGTGLAQLTDTTGDSYYPKISGDGSLIVFTSTADLVTGQNTDGNAELFIMNSDGSGIIQITQTTSTFGVSWLAGIEISEDSSTVVFASKADLADENPTSKTMVYAYKTATSTIVQVNPEHSENFTTYLPSVSSNGSRVTFLSRVDFTGGNSTNKPEHYLATQY